MDTFAQIKTAITEDLNDNGVTFTDSDLSSSLQDAYDDIALLTKCIIKKRAGLSFIANLSYYQLGSYITDYLQAIAVYDVNAKRFLRDDKTLRQIELEDSRWETVTGTPEFWTPASFDKIAITPKYSDSGKTYDLYYSAKAPVVVHNETPLLHAGREKLLYQYVLGDLLEVYREFNKASMYWELYYAGIEEYADIVKTLARADLMAIV